LTPALISDFGGVLTSPLIEGFLAYQDESGVAFEELGKAMGRVAEAHGAHPLFQLERGEISEAEFGELVQSELEQELDFARLRTLYFEHLHPNRPMIDYVREVRARGVRTALLTNNVREWEPRWRAKLPELDEIFEVVVDSAFVGMRKPERGIYELTLERLGIDARDCVFVDDLAHNCDAARELGMTAVLFETAEQAIPEIDAVLDSK
jgi:putative hydrolase of the HAD superfamily